MESPAAKGTFAPGTGWLFMVVVVLAFFGPGTMVAAESGRPVPARAMQLLHANCLSCHNAEKQKGSLDLSTRETFLKGGGSGPVFLSDTPKDSPLLKVLAPDADPHMPPKKQLSTNQIALLEEWIAGGAAYDESALAHAAEPRTVTLEPLPPSFGPVLAIALSPDGTRLAIGRRNEIVLHDVSATNFPIVATASAGFDAVRALAWSPDGAQLASGTFREAIVWKAADLSKVWSTPEELNGHVSALCFSPHGGALIVAEGASGQPSWLRIFAAENGREISSWQAHEDSVYDLTISPDGGLLASAGADNLVKLWELVSQKEVAQLEGHANVVLGIAFNTNATEIVSVSSDKQLRVWDVKSRESVVTIGPKNHGFNSVAWSANGSTVVAGDDDGHLVRFTDFKRHTGAQSSETANERQLRRWEHPVNAVAINADATRIYAGTQDGLAYVLDGEGKVLATLEAPELIGPPMLATPSEAPSFVRDVLPALAKAGCMAGACHAKPEGQHGFKLSVFNFDPKTDFNEIVKDARGRRVFPAAPAESLLLLKPTMAVEHGGGQRIEPGSETYQTVVKWIRGGMIYQHENEPTLTHVVVDPRDKTYTRGEAQQLTLQAHYSDGSTRDVTHLADFSSNDKEIARVDEAGRVQAGTIQGEGVVVARFMGFVDASHVTVPSEVKVSPEQYAALPVNNFIDRLAYAQFQKLGLFPSDRATDAEFLRRSSIDTVGVLPTREEARAFLLDSDPGKRKQWVERLLRHSAYGDFWANKWADLLRPNPDRVGVKSVFMLDQWLRESFRQNKPYDEFVRDILLAEGSNHQDGPIVVYRDRREPPEITTMFSQLFMGVRMECAKCHHHPNEKWSQDDFYQLAAYFGPLKQKGGGLSPPISAGTETFYFGTGRAVKHPVTDEVMKPRPLDGPVASAEEGADPRRHLADWLTNPENPFFAKAAVNRVWASFFGRGFVEPVDDFRVSNPAVHEPLLEALADDFANHGYDMKHLMRTILNSHLYQLSSLPNDSNLKDTKNFSRSYRRRLPAEVLLDAVDDVTGVRETFEGSPPGTRAIQTWSYKVNSHFMDAFGRPNSSSDCPCERDLQTSVVQSLHMMNSREIQSKLASGEGFVKKLVESGKNGRDIATELYLATYNRFPNEEELKLASEPFEAAEANRQAVTEDLLWALLNSPEFVFNH